MKICTVPVERAQELCPDPRIFNVCSQGLSCCLTKKEIKEHLEKWNSLCEENNCSYLKEKPVKETKEAYYYNFPKGRFYIIRWLKSGGYHLYPIEDGKLPDGFETREAAQKFIDCWQLEGKVVMGKQASKYPVPKRW